MKNIKNMSLKELHQLKLDVISEMYKKVGLVITPKSTEGDKNE